MKSHNSILISLVSLRLFVDHDVSAFHVVRLPRSVARQQPPRKTTPSAVISQSTALPMFGGMFGGSRSKLALDEPVTVYSASDDDTQVQFEGLSEYISEWANNMFTNGGIKLTTPVVVEPVSSKDARGVRLLFRDTSTGYKSKNEESESGKAPSNDDPKNKKKSKKMQGGVEIVVEKTGAPGVQVLARRCEIDEDTIVKEMSEETILSELKQAIDVWKREK